MGFEPVRYVTKQKEAPPDRYPNPDKKKTEDEVFNQTGITKRTTAYSIKDTALKTEAKGDRYKAIPIFGQRYHNINKELLLHIADTEAESLLPLCNKLKPGSLMDDREVWEDPSKATCTTCVKRYAAMKASKSLKEESYVSNIMIPGYKWEHEGVQYESDIVVYVEPDTPAPNVSGSDDPEWTTPNEVGGFEVVEIYELHTTRPVSREVFDAFEDESNSDAFVKAVYQAARDNGLQEQAEVKTPIPFKRGDKVKTDTGKIGEVGMTGYYRNKPYVSVGFDVPGEEYQDHVSFRKQGKKWESDSHRREYGATIELLKQESASKEKSAFGKDGSKRMSEAKEFERYDGSVQSPEEAAQVANAWSSAFREMQKLERVLLMQEVANKKDTERVEKISKAADKVKALIRSWAELHKKGGSLLV